MRLKKVYISLFFFIGFCSVVFPQLQPQSTNVLNGTVIINGPDTVCQGTSGFMTLNGATSSPAYWQVSTTAGVTWSNITNTNVTNTYFMAMNNLCFRVILVNGDTSQTTCLTVDPASDAGNITGGGSFCNSASGLLSTTGVTGVASGWYLVNGSTYTSLNNTTSSQAFSAISQSATYAYVVKSGVCKADTSQISINVSPLSDAGTLGSDNTVCASGNTGTLSGNAQSGAISAWQYSVNAGNTWVNTGTLAATYTYNNITQTTLYRRIVKSGVCPADTSNYVTIQVDAPAVAGTLSGGGIYCGAPASGTLSLSGHSGTVSAWQYSVNNGTNWIVATGTAATFNYSNLTQTTLFRVLIGNGVCPTVYAGPDTVFYSPSALAGTINPSATQLCLGSQLTLAVNNYNGNHLQWQVSQNGGTNWSNMPYTIDNITFPLSDTSLFRVIVSNTLCPSDTSAITSVLAIPYPLVNILNKDTIIDQGNTIPLLATGQGTPSWFPAESMSSPNSFATQATPYSSTWYYLTASKNGCSSRDSVFIQVNEGEYQGMIANTITPNGDGINDAFYIEHIEVFKSSDLSIFNEYGQLIFHESPYLNDWKGTYNNSRLPDGVYYYVLKFSDKSKLFKGSITITSRP